MKVLIRLGLKQASLGQSILKAMKANCVISLFLFGLGVEIDHAIGLKTLLTEISQSWHMLSLMMKLSDINSQS